MFKFQGGFVFLFIPIELIMAATDIITRHDIHTFIRIANTESNRNISTCWLNKYEMFCWGLSTKTAKHPVDLPTYVQFPLKKVNHGSFLLTIYYDRSLPVLDTLIGSFGFNDSCPTVLCQWNLAGLAATNNNTNSLNPP